MYTSRSDVEILFSIHLWDQELLGMVAKKHGRNYIGCELHEDYASLQTDRIDSIPSQLVL